MTQDSTEERRRKHMAVMDDKNADWQSEAMHQNKLLHDALTCIEEIGAQLKMVLEREAETQARHDNKIDDLEAKLAKALSMLVAIGGTHTSGGGKASVMAFHAREALAEIKGETK